MKKRIEDIYKHSKSQSKCISSHTDYEWPTCTIKNQGKSEWGKRTKDILPLKIPTV